jgi:hypothetical protein
LRCDLPKGATPGVYEVSLVSNTGQMLTDSSRDRHLVVTTNRLQMDSASIRKVYNGIQEVRMLIQGIDERREAANGLHRLALSGACLAANDSNASGQEGSESTLVLHD